MLVHQSYWDPHGLQLLGKAAATDRARISSIDCSLADCPLRAAGQCLMLGTLGGTNCPYGTYQVQKGPQKRAKAYKTKAWLEEHRDKTVPWLDAPPKRIAFVGDYVYLPYPFMDHCHEVPFLEHAVGFVITGTPLLRREHWTLETIRTLMAFRPRSWMGSEIRSYQEETMPRFIDHLYEVDRELWQQAVAGTGYDKPPNYVGRMAKIRTLKYPITIAAKHAKYPVKWEWDGVRLRTTSKHAYQSTCGGVTAASQEIFIVPAEDAAVPVESSDWVLPGTIFVD